MQGVEQHPAFCVVDLVGGEGVHHVCPRMAYGEGVGKLGNSRQYLDGWKIAPYGFALLVRNVMEVAEFLRTQGHGLALVSISQASGAGSFLFHRHGANNIRHWLEPQKAYTLPPPLLVICT